MELTLEVRWFYEGDVPRVVNDWFATLEPKKEDRREDVYVRPPHAALNVKLREGEVQVKRRGAGGGLIRFRPGVVGCMERWHKWSFPVGQDVLKLGNYDAPPGMWRRVVKERYRRVFDLAEQASLVAEAPGEGAAHTEVELTHVTLGSRPWWTLCIEAEGDAEALLRTLRPMGHHLFAHGSPPTLEAHRSYGYAEWLLGVCGAAESMGAQQL